MQKSYYVKVGKKTKHKSLVKKAVDVIYGLLACLLFTAIVYALILMSSPY